MTQKIGVDEIKSGRDQKISGGSQLLPLTLPKLTSLSFLVVIVKRFLLKWIGMIPDDLELAHRSVHHDSPPPSCHQLLTVAIDGPAVDTFVASNILSILAPTSTPTLSKVNGSTSSSPP
jgi:hypothetical protein